jgi:tetratricopeptide (TPR) repeat protein
VPRASAIAASLALALAASSSARADDAEVGDFDEQAERHDGFWSRVLHPNHGRWRALVDEARKAYDENDAKRALTLLDEAVKLEPTEAEGHYWRGLILGSGLDRWAECAEAYSKVVTLRPDFKPPPRPNSEMPFDFHYGTCLALGGRLEDSIPHYQRVLASGVPKPADRAVILWNLGDSYQALGRLEEAIDTYKDGIEAQPTHAMLRLSLGVAYDRDGQVALAVDAIQESLGIDPSASMTAPTGARALFVPSEDEDYYRGIAHKVARRRALAIVYFRSYLQRAPKSAWASRAREHLAQLGAPALGEADVEVRGVTAEHKGPWQKPVVLAAAELQKCLDGKPLARVLVEIGLPADRAEKAPKPDKADKADKPKADKKAVQKPPLVAKVNPGVQVTQDGPPPTLDAAVLDCVRKRAEKIKLPRPKDGSVVVSIGVIAR